MELDIFERKLAGRDYCFPKLDSGKVIYKPVLMAKDEYFIESTPYDHNKQIMISVYKYIPKGVNEYNRPVWGEELIAEIDCKGLEDVVSAVDGLDLLIKGSPASPFVRILIDKNLHYIKKKNWMCRT